MNKKILVVDDEQRIVELLSKILTREGMQVWTATNGETGLKLAEEVVPDLVILDLLMPWMDGGAVAASLQENHKTKDIPVIFLTCAISEKEVAARAGMSDRAVYIAKESNIVELVKAIKKALGVAV
jgi:CheY-like chemotaxis protein